VELHTKILHRRQNHARIAKYQHNHHLPTEIAMRINKDTGRLEAVFPFETLRLDSKENTSEITIPHKQGFREVNEGPVAVQNEIHSPESLDFQDKKNEMQKVVHFREFTPDNFSGKFKKRYNIGELRGEEILPIENDNFDEYLTQGKRKVEQAIRYPKEKLDSMLQVNEAIDIGVEEFFMELMDTLLQGYNNHRIDLVREIESLHPRDKSEKKRLQEELKLLDEAIEEQKRLPYEKGRQACDTIRENIKDSRVHRMRNIATEAKKCIESHWRKNRRSNRESRGKS